MAYGKRWAMALTIATLLGSGHASAQRDDPDYPPVVPPPGTVVASPEALLTKLFGKPIGWIIKATGDLNGDGRDDWAGVVQWDASSVNQAQLFILLQRADGTFVLTEQSRASDTYRAGVEDLTIEDRGVLTLQYSVSCSATCHAGVKLHYKFYKGAWTLVGSDEESFETDSQAETRYSTNFLTGRTVTDVMASNGKVASSTVGHTDKRPALLQDVSVFGN